MQEVGRMQLSQTIRLHQTPTIVPSSDVGNAFIITPVIDDHVASIEEHVVEAADIDVVCAF